MQYHYGRRAQIVTMVCSVLVLLGASIAYHVLMQECLFKLVSAALKWNRPNEMTSTNSSWSPKDAALAILVLYPLTNMKNVSALVTLNSFGIPFVLYSIFFIIYHGIQASCCAPPGALDFIVITGKPTFGILGGIVTLSFFIHNAIQPIIRNSNPATQRVSTYYARWRIKAHRIEGCVSCVFYSRHQLSRRRSSRIHWFWSIVGNIREFFRRFSINVRSHFVEFMA